MSYLFHTYLDWNISNMPTTLVVTPIPGMEAGDFKQKDNQFSFLIFVGFTMGFCMITCCVYTLNRWMVTPQRGPARRSSAVTVPGSHMLFTTPNEAHYNEALVRMTQSHLAASLTSHMATIPHPEVIQLDNLAKPPNYDTAPPPRYSQIYPEGGPVLTSQDQAEHVIYSPGCPTISSHDQTGHVIPSQDQVPPPREADL